MRKTEAKQIGFKSKDRYAGCNGCIKRSNETDLCSERRPCLNFKHRYKVVVDNATKTMELLAKYQRASFK